MGKVSLGGTENEETEEKTLMKCIDLNGNDPVIPAWASTVWMAWLAVIYRSDDSELWNE